MSTEAKNLQPLLCAKGDPSTSCSFPGLKLHLFVPSSKTKEHAQYFNRKSDFVLPLEKNEKLLS